MTIYVNHIGYTPKAAKFCLMGGDLSAEFFVRNQTDNQVVLQGRLTQTKSDFGVYTVGEFSSLRQDGTYYIEAGRERSPSFRVAPDVYEDALLKITGYFTLQRCGNTKLGWRGSACHTDDGIRGDTLKHQDVEGGWHDACDLRKWVPPTLIGLFGLTRLKENLVLSWDQGKIEEELRWGNLYFIKMQEPEGYLMSHCGGDYFVHADNNRWTDNNPDGKDDRMIDTRPADTITQWIYILSEATIARLLVDSDPEYARASMESAQHALNWVMKENITRSAGELGAAIAALVEIYRTINDNRLLELVVRYADALLELQVTRPEDSHSASIYGFFWNKRDALRPPDTLEPYKSIWQGCWPLQGLVDLYALYPNHPKSGLWADAIKLYCDHYLKPMTERNAFGIIPYGLFRKDPGGNRDLGRFWYRWFMEANPDWYVGINSNLASTGMALAKAAKILNQSKWAAMAQRQLDWILGVNPFNACTVMGVGFNNPQPMFGGEFYPSTPYLPGAVMNGISGDEHDHPQLRPGSWQECEYWTPMVAYTMGLITEITNS
jgi:hypothetical protein